MNPIAITATIFGALLIGAVIMESRAPIPSTPTGSADLKQTLSSPEPAADGQQMSAIDPTDLVSNAGFQAKYPGYIEAVRTLIVASGHRCDTMMALWARGDSPDGAKLEARCGADSLSTTERYAVYPQKQKVDVCEDAIGSSCQ